MSARTVLVVEDDLLIRLMLVEALQDDGYAVVEAGNVLEAVAAIGRNPSFDALVTDVDMPGYLTGLDLAAMVASVSARTQIIVVSGRDVSESVEIGWAFMPKPYSLDQLLNLLDEANGVTPQAPEMAQAV
ncbi:response regulator [Agrobacterium larrymoorei]|uniref:Response regulator n=1 Tax=Agrobacterium larrymoorei TaxID=160699 RepID=A0A4D7DYI6_9HYPH|nr:response regulator [Agrobacterium larrymoorei]QCI99236.1 response regulator [Agrobacterium larrymoorei]QYA08708.1 response regulator [Agrobacterium larrymoorei]QYA08772.1 response regulator [Agrobacterium larrymoorei]